MLRGVGAVWVIQRAKAAAVQQKKGTIVYVFFFCISVPEQNSRQATSE